MPQSVAIVTGTRKGLGHFIATKFLGLGWRVYGCSRRPASLSDPNYTHFELDVGNEAAVVGMVRFVARSAGRLDALVNNAGIASMNHLLLTPSSVVRSIFETNFMGSFLFLRETAKVMRHQERGRIINFSTIAVPFDLEGEAVYAASKAAVESLTRVASRELAENRITVNAIGPSPIATDLIKSIPQDKIEALLHRQAIHRLGTGEDVWNLIEFFLRPESDFITGQIVYLGGVHP